MAYTDFRGRPPRVLTDCLREHVAKALWYGSFDVAEYARKYLGDDSADGEPSQSSVETIAGAFETLLDERAVRLADSDDNPYEWDSERTPLKRIVIHHSAYREGISLPALSALELVRIYAAAYRNPAPDDKPRIAGKPLYSGHFDTDGRQVFYAYHWLIRQDGQALRLLDDDQVGWHAGAWGVNCDGIGICFDDDLTDTMPNERMLASAATIIRSYGDRIALGPETIVGHRDVTDGTICPGNDFASGTAWKRGLVGLVRE